MREGLDMTRSIQWAISVDKLDRSTGLMLQTVSEEKVMGDERLMLVTVEKG